MPDEAEIAAIRSYCITQGIGLERVTFHAALSENPDARRERMQALRETVLRHNIFDWAIEVFDTVQRLTLRTPQTESAGMPAGERSESGR